MKRLLTLVLATCIGLVLVITMAIILQGTYPAALAAEPLAHAEVGSPALTTSTQEPFTLAGIAAYEGIRESGIEVDCTFPYVRHDPAGRTTRLFYQNTSAVSETFVTIRLYESAVATPTVTITHTNIKPLARGSLDLSDVSATPFIGAAIIDGSEQPLACSADILDESTDTLDMMAYRPHMMGAWEFFVPQVQRELAGWNSKLVLFNYNNFSNSASMIFHQENGMPVFTSTVDLDPHEIVIFDVTTETGFPTALEGWAHVNAAQDLSMVLINENQLGDAVAITPWDSIPSGDEVLPWVERDPPAEIILYNVSSSQQISRPVSFWTGKDGQIAAFWDPMLVPYASMARSTDDGLLGLPGDWRGAVSSSDPSGGGMVATLDLDGTRAGYSSLPSWGGMTFYLPNIFRYPNRVSAFAVYGQGVFSDNITVEYYDVYGNMVISYTKPISSNVSLRFAQSDMPELGPTFEGSARVTANTMNLAVVVWEEMMGPPPLDSYEPNDDPSEAYTLTTGVPITSYIGHAEDIDWYTFEVITPSLVTITLDQLPADYDLAVFSDLANIPEAPNSQSLDQLADTSSVDSEGELNAIGRAWLASGRAWLASGRAWLASGRAWLASGRAWLASSSQLGQDPEQAHIIAFEPGTYYILIYPANNEDSTEPYRLSVETEPLAGSMSCGWSHDYTAIQPAGSYIGSSAGIFTPVQTLILYNKTRLDRTYGFTAGNAISNALGHLADEDSVRGIVVPVDNSAAVSATYTAWNQNPNYCSAGKANAVADAIRDYVISPTLDYSLFDIQYVVIIGGDEQVPFYRVPDETAIANERTYAAGVQANPAALPAAISMGYILSDDAYGTPPGEELYWRGRELWLPDLAVGRLVETPDEILGFVNSYVGGNQSLDAQTALATGYDFLTDSAEAISDTFNAQGLTTTILISETWDADDLRFAWPGDAPDLASVNAHFEHWQAIPATTTLGTVYNTDLQAGEYSGTLGFSMGCHAGLNVPDGDVSNTTTSPDIPQALAQKGGYWVGNTGYGYGMDDAIEASEMLMWMFSQELGKDQNVPAGKAFVQAKQRYFGSLPSGGLSLYHEKAMIEATFYGLPMYQVTVPTMQPSTSAGTSTVSEAQFTGQPGLWAVDVTIEPEFERRDTPDGSFYSVGGEVWGGPGRPIQPRATVPITESAWTAHGALLMNGAFVTETDFDPLIARPITDVALAEPTFTAEGWFPVKPFGVNRFGNTDRVVLVPGQYNSADGLLRRYQNADLRVYYSQSDDFTPPAILSVDALTSAGKVSFGVRVFDHSGVHRVVATYDDGQGVWQTVGLTPNSDLHLWTGDLTPASDQVQYFIQAVDKAGNVAVSANKGAFFEPSTPPDQDTFIFLPLVMKGYSDGHLDNRLERDSGRTVIERAPLLQLPVSFAGLDLSSSHRRRRGDLAGGEPGESC